MKKPLLIIGAATLIIILAGIFLFSKNQTQTPPASPFPPTSYEYFWGNGCPHCANVEKFLESWEGKDKVKIDKKEVWSNKDNAGLMAQRAASCGLGRDSLGVPLLVTPEGKCFTGDTPIIDFFKGLKL